MYTIYTIFVTQSFLSATSSRNKSAYLRIEQKAIIWIVVSWISSTDFVSSQCFSKVRFPFQGVMMAYPWSSIDGTVFVIKSELDVTQEGLLQDVPSSAAVRLTVRVYVVRALRFCTHDVNGTSDPYLAVKLGRHTNTDIPRQLNPVFGSYWEEVLLGLRYVMLLIEPHIFIKSLTNLMLPGWICIFGLKDRSLASAVGKKCSRLRPRVCVIWALLASSG
jgi:hypothetical protein